MPSQWPSSSMPLLKSKVGVGTVSVVVVVVEVELTAWPDEVATVAVVSVSLVAVEACSPQPESPATHRVPAATTAAMRSLGERRCFMETSPGWGGHARGVRC